MRYCSLLFSAYRVPNIEWLLLYWIQAVQWSHLPELSNTADHGSHEQLTPLNLSHHSLYITNYCPKIMKLQLERPSPVEGKSELEMYDIVIWENFFWNVSLIKKQTNNKCSSYKGNFYFSERNYRLWYVAKGILFRKAIFTYGTVKNNYIKIFFNPAVQMLCS